MKLKIVNKIDGTPGLVPVSRLFGSGIPVSSRTRAIFQIQSRPGLGLDESKKRGLVSLCLETK